MSKQRIKEATKMHTRKDIIGRYESSKQALYINTADETTGIFTGRLYETKVDRGDHVSISGHYHFWDEKLCTEVEFRALGATWNFVAYYLANKPSFAKLCANNSAPPVASEDFIKDTVSM
ncbi:hypothetical protein [Pseudomonas sp.]|uniref:hypothetical protein n=1 Tax=Pseudomonas sp. TaxID=306 RepID=UPI002E344D4C|nr:hypothetical protein [Pseudomonas sp.]HEX4549259.1 hypothetical protein [Pseudomonas sp.]